MKQALIVWGGWPGHEPEACARIVERMLTEDGFAVTVSLRAVLRIDSDKVRIR